ncbi:Pentatricopeptide repeat-containing protein [Acorus gramineus]|uniref:Pentatricopeptide repeat-containing protein n=1 Tax=Acorus gramineus TaxID=55184 RepID=A0AAV9BRT7_ACOGR|nr:Pentatricopeptide repeat-containing protein [Acorus gramineus]
MAKNLTKLFGAATENRRLCTPAAAVVAKPTKAAEVTAEPRTAAEKGKPLRRRLLELKGTGGSVAKTMNDWVSGGRSVKNMELQWLVRELRKHKHYEHAIQLMDWMKTKKTQMSHSDSAIRLDLVYKVKGIASAEKYFESLSELKKNKLTYGSLLSCYCSKKMKDKAVSLFEKIKNLGFASTPLPYANLMNMYLKLGEPAKVPPLFEDMKSRGISPDSITYSILLNSLAAQDDIGGIETVMEEIKSNKVKRVWHAMKSTFPVIPNRVYLIVLYSLDKIDDFEGLKECFEEWEMTCETYDTRLMIPLLGAYIRRDMMGEAKAIIEKAKEKGAEPTMKAWELFIEGYLKKGEVERALEFVEVAIVEGKPSKENVSLFMRYFEERGDVEGAEKFCSRLKGLGGLDAEVSEALQRIRSGGGSDAVEIQSVEAT